MSTVETVRGPVDVNELGPTLMHEHLFFLNTEYQQNNTYWDEDERVAEAVERLHSVAAKGIRTLVDPTVLGLGRHIPRVRRIADQVPEIHIIVATGVYTYHDLPFIYLHRGPGTLMDSGGTDPMALDFQRDINEGIADTGVKAAVLKCAVEEAGLVPGVDRVCTAVAHAHRETGVPIIVHTNSTHQTGRAALALFRSEGVDLSKVIVAHAGDTNDLAYLMELADTGATLGMDRFGIDVYNPTPDRVATIAALCGRGYADRMVLSHDTCCYSDWFGEEAASLRGTLLPNWHYEHISDDVLPALRAAGVSDKDIDIMMIDNPRRYFS